MHVIQHLLLMNLAPIFLVLGAPVTLALQASGRPTQTTILRVLHHPFVEFVTNPLVVLAVFSVTMIGYFLTPLYPFSLEHPLLHDYTHLHFLIVGCLYWSLVVGIDPSRWRLSVPMKLGFLAVGIPIATILGIALTETKTSIAPAFHTLLDTHIGGSILWIVSEVFTFSAITIVVVQWMHSDMRDAVRMDRRADAEYARRVEDHGADDGARADGADGDSVRSGAERALTEVTVVNGRLVSVPSRPRASPPA
jgi:putative copper resistance protein D